jgi:galactoside O-acetyltransferase
MPVKRVLRRIARAIYWRFMSLVEEPRPVQPAIPARGGCWEAYRSYVRVHPTAIIAPQAQIKFFNPAEPAAIRVEIGEGSHVFASFSLLRSASAVRIGARCQIGNVSFVCAQEIVIGDDVLMAWGITVIDSDNHSIHWRHRQYDVERCRRDYITTNGADIARSHDWSKVDIAPVRIGDKAWVGFNVIVLKGVTIGEGAVIGAGSVVTKDIPPWHMAAGNPCQVKRRLSPE